MMLKYAHHIYWTEFILFFCSPTVHGCANSAAPWMARSGQKNRARSQTPSGADAAYANAVFDAARSASVPANFFYILMLLLFDIIFLIWVL